MKRIAPVLLALGSAITAITTAIAGARGAFKSVVPLTPYMVAYGVALLVFAIAALSYYAQDETPNIAPVRFGRLTSGTKNLVGFWGLFVANDNDPAYEVHVSTRKPLATQS